MESTTPGLKTRGSVESTTRGSVESAVESRAGGSAGLILRIALLAGVGVTAVVWLLAGSYYAHRITDIALASEDLDVRYLRSEELLSTVRADVLLGSIDLRDAILNTDPRTTATYRQRIHDAYVAATDALRQLRPLVDSAEARDHLAGLRRDVDAFHSTLSDVLAANARTWKTDARQNLESRIVPEGEHVIGESEQLQSFNQTTLVEQEARYAEEYVTAVRGVWGSLGLGVLTTLGVALVAGRQARRLEARVAQEAARATRHEQDLQHVSARLLGLQEDERRTVARELHDEVGQVLTALKLELAAVQTAMTHGPADGHALDDARAIADRALRSVRDLSHLMYPASLEHLGLVAALTASVEECRDRSGVDITFVHEGLLPSIPPAVAATVYRVVQEALTNVLRHAAAAQCRVDVRRRDDRLIVTVSDDGRGFEPAASEARFPAGLGLLGMRARVAQVAGTIRIESSPGKGTRVIGAIPINLPDQGDSPASPPHV